MGLYNYSHALGHFVRGLSLYTSTQVQVCCSSVFLIFNVLTMSKSSTDEGEDHEQLISEKRPPCCCDAYQSDDPEKRVSPFAVVILLVLFLIYVLNQADRLVLPVSIPAGLRCHASVASQCNNTNFSNSALEINLMNLPASNKSEDCIEFNDEQQGLLTG